MRPIVAFAAACLTAFATTAPASSGGPAVPSFITYRNDGILSSMSTAREMELCPLLQSPRRARISICDRLDDRRGKIHAGWIAGSACRCRRHLVRGDRRLWCVLRHRDVARIPHGDLEQERLPVAVEVATPITRDAGKYSRAPCPASIGRNFHRQEPDGALMCWPGPAHVTRQVSLAAPCSAPDAAPSGPDGSLWQPHQPSWSDSTRANPVPRTRACS